MADQYYVGNQIRLSCTFAVSGSNTDPTTITLTVYDPSGNTDSYTYAGGTVTKSATGVFYKDISLDERGWWRYRWAGTGTCEAADEGEVYAK